MRPGRDLHLLLTCTLCALALTSACSFDGSTPKDAQLTCGGAADCPDDLVCSPLLSRCVPISGDREAPLVSNGSVSDTRLGPNDVLHATLDVDEPLDPSSLLQVGDLQVALTRDEDAPSPEVLRYVASVEAASLGTGIFAVSAVVVDALGNVGAAILGTVEVDTDPPLVVPGSVRITVTTPPGVVASADPALAIGGAIEVALRLNDLTSEATRVVVRRGDVEALVLELTFRDAFDFVFAAGLDEPTEDGRYQVVAQLQDDVGNQADVVLGEIEVAAAAASLCFAVHADGSPLCTDADNDGAFGPGAGCAQGEATDCDDTRPLVFPGAIEVPGNDLDDDCDGSESSLDDPRVLERSIFVAPGAPAEAAGTPEDPLGDLDVAATRAAALEDPASSFIFVREGTFDVGADGIDIPGNLVGGLNDTWSARVGTTELSVNTAVPLRVSSASNQLLSGLTIRGHACQSISTDNVATDAFIALEAVHVDSLEDGSCSQTNAVYLYGHLARVHGSSVRMRRATDYGQLYAIGSDDLLMSDSRIDIECENCDVIGIRMDSGSVVRVQIAATGDGPVGVIGDVVALVSSEIELTRSAAAYFGPEGAVLYQGDVIHSKIEVNGAEGIGARFDAGRVVGNDFIASGASSVAFLIEDYGLGGPQLHANRFAADPAGCALRFGRDDLTCLSIDPCDDCAAASENTMAPASPAPFAAADFGAPSTMALDIDGVCRGPAEPVGAHAQ